MSRTRRAGPATVRLDSGQTYVGVVIYDGQAVTLDGERRHRCDTADGPREHRYPVSKTWPLRRVDEIEWHEDEPA
jgi:hypothetical protein